MTRYFTPIPKHNRLLFFIEYIEDQCKETTLSEIVLAYKVHLTIAQLLLQKIERRGQELKNEILTSLNQAGASSHRLPTRYIKYRPF